MVVPSFFSAWVRLEDGEREGYFVKYGSGTDGNTSRRISSAHERSH